jgi:protein-S-isoprenylcysteine O-methyltransferase Ste14
VSAHLGTVKPTTHGAILRDSFSLRKARRGVDWREAAFRSAAVFATGLFVVRAAAAVAANPGRITLLLVVLSESLSAALLLLSTAPKTRDTHPIALLCVGWACFYCALFDVQEGSNLLSPAMGSLMCGAGMALSIWGKMVIGTSFGLLPATRRVVRGGPYRFVRHPIYAGYFATHAGFILSDFTLRNLAILVTLYLCQFVRVLREERVLRQEDSYREYCRAVPYRFCYGVF